MAIPIGQKAPAFSLYDHAKNNTSLSTYQGRNVVLLFFPFAFTSVCTAELCTVRDNLASFNNFNAQVFGISVDPLFSLNKFREEQQLNFPLLSDFNKSVSAAYGVLYDVFPAFEYAGVSKRAAFVIDKTGIVQYSEVCVSPGDQPNFAAIQQTLASLN